MIPYNGWTRSNHRKLSNTLSAKQGGLRKGENECCMRNKWRRSAKKTKKISGRGLQKWNVRRRRNVKLTGRRSKRGSVVQRKQGPKLLGRGNIPGALSKAPSCNPGILYFLRHVRYSHNTMLPCCTCHCFSLLNYLVYSKGLSVIYRSSTNVLGLYFVIVALFTKLYCKPGIYDP